MAPLEPSLNKGEKGEVADKTGKRLVYILERFPADTLNFVYNEIEILEQQGIAIDIYSLLPCIFCPDEAQAFLARTVAIKPVSPSSLLAALLYYSLRRPARLLSLFVTFPLDCQSGFLKKWPRTLSHVLYGVYFAYMLRSRKDHIHSHFAHKAATAALCASRLNGNTFSFTAHGSATIHAPSRYGLATKVTASKFVVAVSEFNRKVILELLPQVPRDKVIVNRTGIRLDRFPFMPKPRIPRSPLRILVLASLYPIKNHEGILDACGILAKRSVPFHLDLVGKDEDTCWPKLRDRASTLGIEELITFHGVIDHSLVAERIQAADLLLLASHSEGIPVAMMEAMATGTPVLGPRITGVPELVEEGVSGWLADPGNPEEFGSIMERLYWEEGLLDSVKGPARKKIEEEFDMVTNAKHLAAIFLRNT